MTGAAIKSSLKVFIFVISFVYFFEYKSEMVIFCNEYSEAELAYASFELILCNINIKNINSLFVSHFI